MTVDDWEIWVHRYSSETLGGQVVYRPAPPWLSGYVLGYSGWDMDTTVPVQRRLLPFGGVCVLLDFAPSVRMPPVRPVQPGRTGFRFPVAGMHNFPFVFGQAGRHFGLAIGLTPAGAYALFGTPMHEFANVLVELDDLIGGRAEQLAGRLAQARTWSARFDLLDGLLPRWLQAGPAQLDEVAHAWRLLRQASGRITVAELANAIGRSRRYLELRFRDQVGIPPKAAARIVRFQQALRLATCSGPPAWTEVAARCGYVDQAHLTRDFRQLAGCTPTYLLARKENWRRPDVRLAATFIGGTVCVSPGPLTVRPGPARRRTPGQARRSVRPPARPRSPGPWRTREPGRESRN
jgi:AraC-like DNA-binding protein